MNKSEEFSEDILCRYINPEKIEKAPEGFSERVMTRIQAERIISVAGERSFRNYLIPVISVLITVTLILSAILLSSTTGDSAVNSVLKPLNDLRITLPEINFDKLAGFTLPELMIYTSIGIFILLLFDRALNTFFHREKK